MAICSRCGEFMLPSCKKCGAGITTLVDACANAGIKVVILEVAPRDNFDSAMDAKKKSNGTHG